MLILFTDIFTDIAVNKSLNAFIRNDEKKLAFQLKRNIVRS